MAKGRVAERTQTGARHSTPAGDRATGTRGSATPGSGEHLKGEWTYGPDLRLPQRPEGRAPQQISGKDRPFSSQGPQQESSVLDWGTCVKLYFLNRLQLKEAVTLTC